MKKRLAWLLIVLTMLILSACQPTPEKPIVVGKTSLDISDAEQTKPYEAPNHIDVEMEGLPDNYRIVFDAEVDVSPQSAWPMYTVELARITQEQADAVRQALLGDAILYKPGKYRTREEIQRSIENYEYELRVSMEDPERESLIDTYKQYLKDLYAEYEKTPENIEMEEADTEFKFMEDQVRPYFYGANKVADEESGFMLEWTDEARRNAIEAGCESIYGICWLESGRKIAFSAKNDNINSGIFFSTTEGSLLMDTSVTYPLGEAITKAEALLNQMGFDFTLADARTKPKFEYVDNEDGYYANKVRSAYHELIYKRTIEGVPQDYIKSCIDQNVSKFSYDYRGPLPHQETITFIMDDDGIQTFYWNSPMCVVSTESANVSLMPFDEVISRIEQQLKVQTLWEDWENEKYLESRRLEVYKLKLSYLMIPVKDDMESYHLVPVWNVCADMYYHYPDDYPIGQGDTYILDEKYERNVWRSLDDEAEYSVLTINAIDGSVIPRWRGY